MIVIGEHTGDFFGIPPKGNNFSYQAAHISRIADDKLVEHKGDSMKIWRQLVRRYLKDKSDILKEDLEVL
jgi:predicted ester cyclase